MKKISANFLGLAVLLSVFYSCRKEMEKPSWDTEVLAPILNAHLDVNNLLPDSLLQANADSSLKIVYQSDIYNLNMDTLFSIPDTTINNGYALPFPYTFNPGQVIPFPSTSSTTYSLPGVELRKAIIRSGKVNFKIKSKIREATDFTYSIPCATLGGSPFTINVTVPASSGSTPGTYNQTFDLSGYVIDLTGPAHTQINTIYTALNASISASAPDTVLVNPTDSLIIENTFFDIVPYYAKGYFGQTTYNVGPDVTNFTLFNRIISGSINLEDVDFNLKLENNIGMDSRVVINQISSINTRTGNFINLTNSVIGSPININRAAESGGTVYPTYANFPLTPTNSNIKPMIENLPDQFGYSLSIQTNPLGNISGSNDFIYADRLFKASLDMEIPLSLVANDLTLCDTLNFNIAGNSQAQNLHSAVLTLFAENGFPFDASLQLYLLNSSNAVTDSLFGYANTIDEAPINSAYRAVGKKLTKLVIPVDETKMNTLYNTQKVVLKVKFNTSAQPNYIKIYSDYSIDVKLVGDLNYTIQLH